MTIAALIVHRQDVKDVKCRLEAGGHYKKNTKIQKLTVNRAKELGIELETVSTLFELSVKQSIGLSVDDLLVGDGQLQPSPNLSNVVIAVDETTLHRQGDHTVGKQEMQPLIRAVRLWLVALPLEIREMLPLGNITSVLPTTYCVYPPMLLLPTHFFATRPWPQILETLPREHLERLWITMTLETGTTHIAINAPIPLRNPEVLSSADGLDLNIIRSPTNLTFLHGDLTSPPKNSNAPSKEDLESAFWVSSIQNSIHQVWAPQYTMFSRGNIREKTRLLKLSFVLSCARESAGFTAVDLFAGIGYFSFSFAKAGARVVLGWEINPWSVEGFRRGIEKNKWSGGIAKTPGNSLDLVQTENNDSETWIDMATSLLHRADGRKSTKPTVLIFPCSNKHSASQIMTLRKSIPPVRHVNLGLLPSSSSAISLAIKALDPVLGGWLHIHENIATHEHEEKAQRTISQVNEITRSAHAIHDGEWCVQLEHVERVKTYAPGVVHCVLDVWVGPVIEKASKVGDT